MPVGVSEIAHSSMKFRVGFSLATEIPPIGWMMESVTSDGIVLQHPSPTRIWVQRPQVTPCDNFDECIV